MIGIANHGEIKWFQLLALRALAFPAEVACLTFLSLHTAFADPQDLKDNRTGTCSFPFIALTTRAWLLALQENMWADRWHEYKAFSSVLKL